jgi:hypothetical protein
MFHLPAIVAGSVDLREIVSDSSRRSFCQTVLREKIFALTFYQTVANGSGFRSCYFVTDLQTANKKII